MSITLTSTVERAFADHLRAEGIPVVVDEVADYRIYRPQVAPNIPSMHTQ